MTPELTEEMCTPVTGVCGVSAIEATYPLKHESRHGNAAAGSGNDHRGGSSPPVPLTGRMSRGGMWRHSIANGGVFWSESLWP